MQHLTGRLGRFSLLLALFVGLLTAVPVVSSGAAAKPQCSDGIDNDGDGAIDGADAGCAGGSDNDESDSPYSGIVEVTHTVALPVVTIQGTVTPKGVVDVKLFQVRALRGSRVKIACDGKACPFKHSTRTMITSTLRITKLQRKLKPSMTLKLRIRRQDDDLGKFMKYEVRKNKSPLRTDRCIDGASGAVVGCYIG